MRSCGTSTGSDSKQKSQHIAWERSQKAAVESETRMSRHGYRERPRLKTPPNVAASRPLNPPNADNRRNFSHCSQHWHHHTSPLILSQNTDRKVDHAMLGPRNHSENRTIAAMRNKHFPKMFTKAVTERSNVVQFALDTKAAGSRIVRRHCAVGHRHLFDITAAVQW